MCRQVYGGGGGVGLTLHVACCCIKSPLRIDKHNDADSAAANAYPAARFHTRMCDESPMLHFHKLQEIEANLRAFI